MKQIVFMIGFVMAFGGWCEHTGFFATTFFILLYVANFALSEQAGKIENFLFNKLLFWATGVGGVIGFVVNKLLKWILRVAGLFVYFTEQSALDEGLSGLGEPLMGWWIIWCLWTIWSLCKKLKAA